MGFCLLSMAKSRKRRGPRNLCTKLTVTNCRLSQRSVAAAGKRECKVAEGRVRKVTILRPPSHCSRTCALARTRVSVCVCARVRVCARAFPLCRRGAPVPPSDTHTKRHRRCCGKGRDSGRHQCSPCGPPRSSSRRLELHQSWCRGPTLAP